MTKHLFYMTCLYKKSGLYGKQSTLVVTWEWEGGRREWEITTTYEYQVPFRTVGNSLKLYYSNCCIIL